MTDKKINFSFADSTQDLVYRRVSDDGKLELGIWPVLFGFRVRAGYVGRLVCEVGWCCGKEHAVLERAYNLCLHLLELGIPFSEIIPHTAIKPVFSDPGFMLWVEKLAENTPWIVDITVDVPPVNLIRREYELLNIFSNQLEY